MRMVFHDCSVCRRKHHKAGQKPVIVVFTGFTENDQETFARTIKKWEEAGYDVVIIHMPDHQNPTMLQWTIVVLWLIKVHFQLVDLYVRNNFQPFRVAFFSISGPCVLFSWLLKPEMFDGFCYVNTAFILQWYLALPLLLIVIPVYYLPAMLAMLSLINLLTEQYMSSQVPIVSLLYYSTEQVLPSSFSDKILYLPSLLIPFLMRLVRIPKTLQITPEYVYTDYEGNKIRHDRIPLVVASHLLILQFIVLVFFVFSLLFRKLPSMPNSMVVLGLNDWVVMHWFTRMLANRFDMHIEPFEDRGHNVLVELNEEEQHKLDLAMERHFSPYVES